MPTFTKASATVWSWAASSASTGASRSSSTDDAPAAARNVSATHSAESAARVPSGRAALEDRARDREIGVRGEEVCDRAGPRRLAHEHDATGVAAERADVGTQPVDGGVQVAQREVARHALGREPAERAESVVEPDDDHVVCGQVHAVVDRKCRAADAIGPARHPDQHGKCGAADVRRDGRADLGGEAVLGLLVGDHPGHEVEPAHGLRWCSTRFGGVERIGPRDRLGQAPPLGARVGHAAESGDRPIGPADDRADRGVDGHARVSRHSGLAARPRGSCDGTAPTRSST